MLERLSLAIILVFALACNSDTESDLSGVQTAPAVMLSDLVATERNDAAAPASPHLISLSQKEIELEGARFIELDGKKLPPRVGDNPGIPLLRQRLSTTPGKQGAVIRVHANASWGALTRILATLKELNVAPVVFEIRKDLSGNTGYLPFESYTIDAKDEAPQPFAGKLQKEWDPIVATWEEMTGNCVGRGAVHCPSPPDAVLKGGLAEVELFAQQDALRIRFRRFFPGRYADEPEESELPPKPKKKPKNDEPEEPPPPPPIGEFEFMWRREAAHVNGSPIALTMRPICGAERCGVVLRSLNMAAAGSVLRLIGSAFPNGTPAPELLIIVPPDA
jgi:hypothetical protein